MEKLASSIQQNIIHIFKKKYYEAKENEE